ncbi:electron transport protein [Alteribacter natronophilus]|uniref:electron transport protein n=1 Tax=Alteribacter natronophilus TaxID=2583810 RepID=UPI00110DDC84|nr:electron transport protein [Alteribacter natronophilus]TMW71414.1 electron transport protein [Alteribacter natronophilus]
MKKKIWWLTAAIVVAIGIITAFTIEFEHAYIPDDNDLLEADRDSFRGFDVWGERVKTNPHASQTGQAKLPEGSVEVDDRLLALGREEFYTETFNNDEYMTDIVGITSGAITLGSIVKATVMLMGRGTDDLQVALAKDLTIGDRTYKKGEKVSTGMDVAKGSFTPIGMPIEYSRGKIRAGASCASCHATVDRDTGKVIEGAPNANFNGGLLLAMAPNSAAYFTNTELEVEKVKEYMDKKRAVKGEDGDTEFLPDPEKVEAAVDEMLVKWPQGNFDSTMDLENNPSQIPDSFTLHDHPYGWNGFASVGPFNGLSVLNNNVHAQNSDLLAQFEQSSELFDMDKEQYIGMILQNAANPNYRYDPDSGEKPSEFFAKLDDTPDVPGVNEMIRPPTFPKLSLYSPNGTVISSPGHRVGEQINAMSAFQNALRPPLKKNTEAASVNADLGRDVFERANCLSCHAGEGYTNHSLIPAEEAKTEPSRAKAFRDTAKLMEEPWIYSPDTPVPIPENARKIRVPTDHLSEAQLDRTLAQGNPGAYKVKGLIGLRWSAPYLHDGGVAVGPDEEVDLGLPGTWEKNIHPDAANSLKGLIDRDLRDKIMRANRQNTDLQEAHVTGEGHEYWVDEEAGFSEEEQQALIDYILDLKLD